MPLIVSSARKLKRVLADEQNEVLDRLRRNQIEDTLPDAEGHAARYVGAVDEELRGAMVAGATSVGATVPTRFGVDVSRPGGADRGHRPAVAGAAPAGGRSSRGRQQRARLARARRATGSGSRPASTTRSTTCCALAFDEGAFGAVATGTPVVWVLDPESGACGPDCEDNSLGGAVAAGDAFPTGHLHPPLHRGLPLPPADRPGVTSPAVRTPSDMPPRAPHPRNDKPRRRFLAGRGRVIVIGALVVLVVLFVSARTIAGYYVDYLWYDALGDSSTYWTLFWAKASLLLLFAGRIRHRRRDQLRRRRPHRAALRSRSGRARVRRPLSRAGRRPPEVGASRRRRDPRAHARCAGHGRVAGLAAVPQLPVVRCGRSAVQHRRRVLRVPTAVPLLRDDVGVRRHRRARSGRRRRLRRQWLAPVPDARPAAGPRRPHPPVADRGGARPRQGRRLLVAALRADDLHARGRARRHLHRRRRHSCRRSTS